MDVVTLKILQCRLGLSLHKCATYRGIAIVCDLKGRHVPIKGLVQVVTRVHSLYDRISVNRLVGYVNKCLTTYFCDHSIDLLAGIIKIREPDLIIIRRVNCYNIDI